VLGESFTSRWSCGRPCHQLDEGPKSSARVAFVSDPYQKLDTLSHGRIEERNFKDSDSLAALDAVHTKSALDGKLLYLSVQALPKHRRLRDHAETQ